MNLKSKLLLLPMLFACAILNVSAFGGGSESGGESGSESGSESSTLSVPYSGSESGDEEQPEPEPVMVRSLKDLAAALRRRQETEPGMPRHEKILGLSCYVYWYNTKLPSDNLAQYNKWCGDNVPGPIGESSIGDTSKVAVLLPTAFSLGNTCMTGKEKLPDIIFNVNNWQIRRAKGNGLVGCLFQPYNAEVKSFEQYIDYLRNSGVRLG